MILAERITVLLALVLLVCTVGTASAADSTDVMSLRAMTYNIRYDTPSDSGQVDWSNRRDKVASMIRFHAADVVGTQEGKLHQLQQLEDRLPGFEWLGVGRASGSDEFSAVFYRKDRLAPLDHETIWLSPTPNEPGSVGWGAALPRIVTWVRFRDRATGDSLLVVNTHFDHESAEARLQSARLIAARVGDWAEGAPAVVMGDLNARVDSPPYEALTAGEADAPSLPLQDAKVVSQQPHHGPTSTLNRFGPDVVPEHRIDYILVSPRIEVRRHGHLNEKWSGAYPSDHLPVLTELLLRTE